MKLQRSRSWALAGVLLAACCHPALGQPPNYPASNYPPPNQPAPNYPASNYPPSNYPVPNYPASSPPAVNMPGYPGGGSPYRFPQPMPAGGVPGMNSAAPPDFSSGFPESFGSTFEQAPNPSQEAEAARIVAIVGELPIFAGDVLPAVRQALEPHEATLPPEQYERQKEMGLKQALKQRIDVKMLYAEFLRTIPAANRDEALKGINKELDEKFYSEQLPKLLEAAQVTSPSELDQKLRHYGSSLAQRRIEYKEQMIAQTMVVRNVRRNREVTHQELLDYYYEHLDEYSFPARARYEKLTARFDRFSSRREAELAIVDMGNQVLRGAPFAEVAKRHSQGTNAEEGGYHDWTTKGALVSEVLDHVLFTIPLGKLSEKLEDDQGFHIVRVIEREEAGRRPFTEAQEKIREALQEEEFRAGVTKYLDEVRARTYVWTVFDDEDEE